MKKYSGSKRDKTKSTKKQNKWNDPHFQYKVFCKSGWGNMLKFKKLHGGVRGVK